MKAEGGVMKFPSIKEVSEGLSGERRFMKATFDIEDWPRVDDTPCVDVRLQVRERGWTLRFGDPGYDRDRDHSGFWGASRIILGRQNMRDLAKDLLAQARDRTAEEEAI
jgi:hypothetical protein